MESQIEGFRSYQPKSIFAKVLSQQYANAVALNFENIRSALEVHPGCSFLDLGCDDGSYSMLWGTATKASRICGVEIVPERAQIARAKGMDVRSGQLNNEIPFEDSSVDIITCNQVIEHLHNSDKFLSEVHRVLKPGGYAVISTENSSSWANVFAAAMGWQIFSLTNFSRRQSGIGNPLALHRGRIEEMESWTHQRIYSLRGLIEYAEVFGFQFIKAYGSGYFPLPCVFGNYDPTHAHFITIKIQKNK